MPLLYLLQKQLQNIFVRFTIFLNIVWAQNKMINPFNFAWHIKFSAVQCIFALFWSSGFTDFSRYTLNLKIHFEPSVFYQPLTRLGERVNDRTVALPNNIFIICVQFNNNYLAFEALFSEFKAKTNTATKMAPLLPCKLTPYYQSCIARQYLAKRANLYYNNSQISRQWRRKKAVSGHTATKRLRDVARGCSSTA